MNKGGSFRGKNRSFLAKRFRAKTWIIPCDHKDVQNASPNLIRRKKTKYGQQITFE